MKYKKNWQDAKGKFEKYWKHENEGRPLMCVIARKPETENVYQKAKAEGRKLYGIICQGEDATLPDELMYRNMTDKYRNAVRMVDRYRHFCETHEFLGESFPNIDVDFGPGSLAGYLGSEIKFNDDTVWFEKCLSDWDSFPNVKYDPENKWWKEHYRLVKDIRALAGDDFLIGMPDLMENIDVLAAMRGTQDMIFDMVDEPDEVTRRIGQVSDVYFRYYDVFCNLVKDPTGGNAYTVFQIWGPGRTAKLQCDFSAMMSPQNFRDFIQKPLRLQAQKLDHVLYHLDGESCIVHMDALMEIDEINALQWTSGDFGPDGTYEKWDIIYDKARAAGKSLWIKVYSGGFEDWIRNTDRIVKRYGSHSLFLYYPEMSMEHAQKLLDYADKNWSNVEGTFKV
jgi:hypothetical protein